MLTLLLLVIAVLIFALGLRMGVVWTRMDAHIDEACRRSREQWLTESLAGLEPERVRAGRS